MGAIGEDGGERIGHDQRFGPAVLPHSNILGWCPSNAANAPSASCRSSAFAFRLDLLISVSFLHLEWLEPVPAELHAAARVVRLSRGADATTTEFIQCWEKARERRNSDAL